MRGRHTNRRRRDDLETTHETNGNRENDDA